MNAELKHLRQYRLAGQLLFILLLMGCLCFLFLIRTHRVDGQSMAPTLADNDRLLVRKNQQPDRYALITIESHNKSNESYVKRVIGMPGDRIWVDNNSLYLNQALAETDTMMESNQSLSGEQLPDGTIKVWVTEAVAQALVHVKVIPDNQYFVLGDNRNHSTDSRQFGLINAASIEGTVIFRYYPFTHMGGIR